MAASYRTIDMLHSVSCNPCMELEPKLPSLAYCKPYTALFCLVLRTVLHNTGWQGAASPMLVAELGAEEFP